jgi:hypothetical protein
MAIVGVIVRTGVFALEPASRPALYMHGICLSAVLIPLFVL